MDHVAIVKPEYLDLILRGKKTIEARLSRTRRSPYGDVFPGDRIFFKASGGGFGALCITYRIHSAPALTPKDVAVLKRRFGKGIAAPAAFWKAKKSARYATLVWLTFVQKTSTGPDYRKIPGARPRDGWIAIGTRDAGPAESAAAKSRRAATAARKAARAKPAPQAKPTSRAKLTTRRAA